MSNLSKYIQNYETVGYADNWALCVSIASSLISTNWQEFFFADATEARQCAKDLRTAGYAVLVVSRDEY